MARVQSFNIVLTIAASLVACSNNPEAATTIDLSGQERADLAIHGIASVQRVTATDYLLLDDNDTPRGTFSMHETPNSSNIELDGVQGWVGGSDERTMTCEADGGCTAVLFVGHIVHRLIAHRRADCTVLEDAILACPQGVEGADRVLPTPLEGCVRTQHEGRLSLDCREREQRALDNVSASVDALLAAPGCGGGGGFDDSCAAVGGYCSPECQSCEGYVSPSSCEDDGTGGGGGGVFHPQCGFFGSGVSYDDSTLGKVDAFDRAKSAAMSNCRAFVRRRPLTESWTCGTTAQVGGSACTSHWSWLWGWYWSCSVEACADPH